MYSALLALLLLTNQIPNSVEAGVLSWHFSPRPGMETGPRCHVWYNWFHVIPPYEMTCFQCGQEYSDIVRFGSVPLGMVHTRDCDSWRTRDAVSITYPDVQSEDPPPPRRLAPLVHTVQYDLEGVVCARVKYRKGLGDRWLPKPSRCDDIKHWESRIGKGFVNGWKTKPFPLAHGVVQSMLNISPGLTDSCRLMRTLPHKRMLYTMKCYDCNNNLMDGYMAVVYVKGAAMSAVTVGTCRSPVLERSVSIVQTGEPRGVGVQYLLAEDTCVLRRYHMVDGGLVEGEETMCPDPTPSILTRTEKLMSIFGYENGWKSMQYDGLVDKIGGHTGLTTTATLPLTMAHPPHQSLTVETIVEPSEVGIPPLDSSTSVPPAPPQFPPLPTEKVMVTEGVVEVAKMPGDGHCLFSSLLHQLKLSHPGAPGHSEAVRQMRQRVVEYVKDQLVTSTDLWKYQLADSVEANPNRYPALDENGNVVPMDTRIDDFLTNLLVDEWGGTETVVAVSHLHKVVTVTYFESASDKHRRVVTYPDGPSGNEIAVVYRLGLLKGKGSRIERVHYDSFVRFV